MYLCSFTLLSVCLEIVHLNTQVALFMAANAAGGLLGGHLGDAAAARWPDHGRVAVCQLSVGLGIPLATILFKVGGRGMPGVHVCGAFDNSRR